MNEPAQQDAITTISPKAAQETTNPAGEPAKSTGTAQRTLLLVIIVLLVIILIIGIVAVIVLITNNKSEDNDETTAVTDQSSTSQASEETSTIETTTEDTNEIASMWNTYENTKWKFSIKHPKDLNPEESVIDATTDEVMFTAGDLTAFTIWIKTDGEMANNLANMLANQSTDTVEYTTVTYMGHKYRKAVDVPMGGCLESLGVERDYELAAYGISLPGGAQLLIRNDGLNKEQLEGVLKSLLFI